MASEIRQKQTDVCADIPKDTPLKKICPTCKPNPNFIEPNWVTSTKPFLNEKNCEYEITVDTNEAGDIFTAEALASEFDLDTYLRTFVIPGIRLMLRYYGKLELNQLLYASIPGLTIAGLTAEELLQAYPTYESAFEQLTSENEPSAEDLAAAVIQIPTKETITDYSGDTYDIFRLDPAIVNNPAITNPFALEIYAYPKDFDIDPITGLGKVRVAIPAFIFDKVPEAPGVAELQVEASETEDYVEIKAEEAFATFTRFSTAMTIYGSYHSYWYSQNPESEIQFKESGDPYYAIDYATLGINFFYDLAKLTFANMPHTELYKVKIEFDNSDPDNMYKITNVKGRLRGCKYQNFTKGGIENFKQKYSTRKKTPLMGYVAKINLIDIDLTARQSYPWLDFIMKYTFPVVHINYGALSQESLQKNGLGCVIDSLNTTGESIRDYILNQTLSLSEILQYEFNTKNCAALKDPTNQPEFKFSQEFTKPFSDAKKASTEAQQSVAQEYAIKIEEKEKELEALKQLFPQVREEYLTATAEYNEAQSAPALGPIGYDDVLEKYNALQEVRKRFDNHIAAEVQIPKDIQKLKREAKKKAASAGKSAAFNAFRNAGPFNDRNLENSRISAVEQFTSQSSLLESIVDLETFGKTGELNFGNFDGQSKEGKGDSIKRMSLCNIRSLSNKAVRCLLSGVTYEDALRKLIKTVLESYDIDLIGIFIEGLPYEEQQKLREQYERDFGSLPLPWESGYDPGALSSTNPYIKHKSRDPENLVQVKNSIEKTKLDTQKISDLEQEIELIESLIKKSERDLLGVEKRIQDTIQTSELIIPNFEEEQYAAVGDRPGPFASDLEKQQYRASFMQASLAVEEKQTSFEAKIKSLQNLSVQVNEELDRLVQKKFNLERELDGLRSGSEPDPGLQTRIDQYNNLSDEQKEETNKQSADAQARDQGAGLFLADPNDPHTPGTYGKTLGNMQKAITQAYINYALDLIDYDVLMKRLERLPGPPVIQRILKSVSCTYQGLFYPPIDSFLSTLTYDPCGDNKGGLLLPVIPKIPNFFDTSFLNVVKKKFVTKIDDVITQVLSSMLLKLLQVIDEALCKSINAVGQFVASGQPDPGVGLAEAFNDAFCPNGTEEERNNTLNSVFGASGMSNEIKDNDFNNAFKTMSSVVSGKEAAALFSKNGSELDINVLNRIASVINAFHPEFSEVLGDTDGVRDIFTRTQKFVPLNVRKELRDFADRTDNRPIYNNICLTKDEYEKWNTDRVNLLTDKGLDESLAKDIIDKANDRALNDLEDVSAIIQQGPDGLMQDALNDLLGFAEDPSCSVNKSAITFEDEQQAALKGQLINDYFKNLERDFLKDIIGDFSSIMQNVLRDKNDQSLAFHEFYANFPLFFPNYVNNRDHWDIRKETAPFFIEPFMDEDNINGVFPDTVGIHMKKQIDQKRSFRTDHVNSGNFKLKFQDRKNGESDDDYSYAFDMKFSYDFDNPFQYSLSVIQKYKDTIYSESQEVALDKTVTLDTSGYLGAYERLDTNQQSQVVFNQARMFKNLISQNVSNLSFDDQLLNSVFDYHTTAMLNYVKKATGETADGSIPAGYSFGYDANQLLTALDLTYVNPEADPNDTSTWKYTYDEQDAVLGKSATENPRVHFLTPSVYGGSYKRPQIYVEPAVYNGWMSLMQTFVPEVEPCEDRDTNFLEIASIRQRVKFLEENIPMDERLSVAPECRDERPYDKLASPTTHALIEGTVIATVRVYVTEFILRTMPIFSSVEYNSKNVDDTMFDTMVDEIEKALKDETAWFTTIQGFVYWLLFLEQSAQVAQRQLKDGLIESTQALEDAFTEIGEVEARYSAEEPIAVLNGAAIAAYGEDFQKTSLSVPYKILLGILEAGGTIGLSLNLIRYASKLYNLYESQAAAKIALRSIIKKEFETLVEKVNFNMRPRPHVHDINKYLLGRNGYVRNSTIRAGEQVIEAPTVENASIPAYGTIQNVAESNDVNPLDGIELAMSIHNLDLPGGNLVDFLADNFSLDLSIDSLSDLANLGNYEIPSLEDIQSSLVSIYSPLQNGFFFLEKYIRVLGKDEQVYTVPQFQDLIRNSGFDPASHLNEHFGNAEIVNDELIGTIGVKYGVRLSYVAPKDVSYSVSDSFSRQERSYRFPPAKAFIKIPDNVVNLMPSPIKELIEPYTSFEVENVFRNIVPLASFEQDLPDYKIDEIDLESQDLGQDVKCYVDKLVEQEDFKLLFDYIFPNKTFVSMLGIYSFYGFFQSIGEDDSERDRGSISDPDSWQDKVFNDTRSRLRKMFASAYRSDDDAYDDEEGASSSRDKDRRFLKNILPLAYLNLDSSINWFMKRRIIAEKPFDSDGKPCKNAFQKLFEDN